MRSMKIFLMLVSASAILCSCSGNDKTIVPEKNPTPTSTPALTTVPTTATTPTPTPTPDLAFLGQSFPGSSPEKFGAGYFAPNEWGPVFSPDGTELFYTAQNMDGNGQYHINYMKLENGVWSKPVPAPFSDKNGSAELEPNFTPDGKKLYYDSERSGGLGGADIWYVTKTDTGWSDPVNAGATINTANNDNFPFFTEDGSMYFCSDRNKGLWDIDIYYAPYKEGAFLPPQRLGDSVNSESWDSNPTVVEDKLFFSSNRGGGFGKGDIYVSTISGGTWGKAELMPNTINSSAAEFGMVLSFDRKYIFFFRRGEGIYWMDAQAWYSLKAIQKPSLDLAV